MDFELLIPIILILSITYAIKMFVDARTRRQLLASSASEDLLRSLVKTEDLKARQTSLRWGIVLTCLAVGFALIESFGWTDVTPGAIAVLLGATGVGNIVVYMISRGSQQPQQ
jgi:hypothetical protein